MALPLMPKATAVWLVEKTALSFEQIAEFCGLHSLEVQAIADGEVATGMVGLDPVANGQITQAEIDRCVADPNARLKLSEPSIPMPHLRAKGPRYTPIAKRSDRPDAIAWLLKHHPELSDGQIAKLIGTTKTTITAVRDRTHWNSPNIRPRHPVELGMCTLEELDNAVKRALRRAKSAAAKSARPKAAEAGEATGAEPAGSEATGAESPATEPATAEPTPEPPTPEPASAEPTDTEPTSTEPAAADTTGAEATGSEAATAEEESAEPKAPGTAPAETIVAGAQH